jgi:hypothetical protein
LRVRNPAQLSRSKLKARFESRCRFFALSVSKDKLAHQAASVGYTRTVTFWLRYVAGKPSMYPHIRWQSVSCPVKILLFVLCFYRGDQVRSHGRTHLSTRSRQRLRKQQHYLISILSFIIALILSLTPSLKSCQIYSRGHGLLHHGRHQTTQIPIRKDLGLSY